METTYITKGYGFNVNQDFARAVEDTPIELAPDEYAGNPNDVIGYIAGRPESSLGFMRAKRIRVRVQKRGLATF